MEHTGKEKQPKSAAKQKPLRNSYIIRKRSQKLLAKVEEIMLRQHEIKQRLEELQARLDAIEEHLDSCRIPITICLDFVPFETPPAKANWAILYVFATSFNDGCYLSAN